MRSLLNVLEQLGLPSEPLPLGRVEEGPQQEFWPTGPPHHEYSQVQRRKSSTSALAESEVE